MISKAFWYLFALEVDFRYGQYGFFDSITFFSNTLFSNLLDEEIILLIMGTITRTQPERIDYMDEFKGMGVHLFGWIWLIALETKQVNVQRSFSCTSLELIETWSDVGGH